MASQNNNNNNNDNAQTNTGDSSDNNSLMQLVEKIHQFLAHQIDNNPNLDSAAKEGLTVANDCIEQAYKLNKKPPSPELLDIYKRNNQQSSTTPRNIGTLLQELTSEVLTRNSEYLTRTAAAATGFDQTNANPNNQQNQAPTEQGPRVEPTTAEPTGNPNQQQQQQQPSATLPNIGALLQNITSTVLTGTNTNLGSRPTAFTGANPDSTNQNTNANQNQSRPSDPVAQATTMATEILGNLFGAGITTPQQQQPQQQQQAASDANATTATESRPTQRVPKVRKNATEAEKMAADSFKNQGNDAMKQDKHQDAMNYYTQAIAIDDNNAIYYSNRAASKSKMGDHHGALSDCQEAIEIDPNYSKAYGRMGLAYASLDDHKNARIAYQKAVELDPTNESYRNNLQIAQEKLSERPAGPGGAAPGGGGDMMSIMSSVMSNPQLVQMAMRSLQDPRMQSLFSNLGATLGGGLAGAGAGGNNAGANTQGANQAGGNTGNGGGGTGGSQNNPNDNNNYFS